MASLLSAVTVVYEPGLITPPPAPPPHQPQIPERMDSLSTLSDSAVCGMYLTYILQTNLTPVMNVFLTVQTCNPAMLINHSCTAIKNKCTILLNLFI